MEYYSEDKFKIPDHQGEKVVLDFYSPCKKGMCQRDVRTTYVNYTSPYNPRQQEPSPLLQMG